MNDSLLGPSGHLAPLLNRIRDQTPARLFHGRSGLSYRTSTQLELRADHAAARDAVHTELVLERDFPEGFFASRPVVEVTSQAESRPQFLARPDLGRRLGPAAREALAQACPRQPDVQLVIGDGLSSAAVIRQVPELLPRLDALIAARGWRSGRLILVHRCRVGVMNEIGEWIAPGVVVLLIGERPGLATAESLSAYLAYRPREGDNDSRRNLISNIHARGTGPETAANRIANLIDQMLLHRISGCDLKEESSQRLMDGQFPSIGDTLGRPDVQPALRAGENVPARCQDLAAARDATNFPKEG
ncbi:Ethanolamine ammonia-lyase light chain [Caulifigura coniformis]|uniref:Ethanolamine ammonia-lyase small subunit n=1 Tax=Caulifigura coniformis TaxID=2527983 RepID=A0A517SAC9_9PLAN|nr:ethanolamine ammonia-lyase subunit EutC [Caulifigura coniformis]QDT53084.1 Ethanolamine ammonia-lyase light chain [Caulifigura coniformis]